MKRWLKLAMGWAFVALGVVGLVLPVLQGVLFLAIGFAILSRESEWVAAQLQKLRTRYPQLSERFETAAAKANSILGRFSIRRSE